MRAFLLKVKESSYASTLFKLYIVWSVVADLSLLIGMIYLMFKLMV